MRRRKARARPAHRERPVMSRLLHISSSPRGAASESLQIASVFIEAFRDAHPDAEVDTWDLWDGSLPAFGPAAAAAKMTVFGGQTPQGEQAVAWRAALDTFARFDAADLLLFSAPMWNSGIPYILKQFIDVISQPGLVFEVDPQAGYTPLLAGRARRRPSSTPARCGGPSSARSSGATSSPPTSPTGCA